MKNEGSTAPLKIFPDGERPFYIQHLLGCPGDCSGWGEPGMLPGVRGGAKSLGKLCGHSPAALTGSSPGRSPQ